MKAERPKMCLDHTCHCLLSCYDEANTEKGGSWFCVGKPIKHTVLQWQGLVHDNNYSMCMYTPFKGILRYMINTGDAEILLELSAKVLEDSCHIECCECHTTNRFNSDYIVVDDKYYCTMCAVRLGLLKWDASKYVKQ